MTSSADAPSGESATRRTRLTRACTAVWSHPLVVVAIGATLVAVGHAVWIWRYRHVGAIDPDEAGYIASALRMRRAIVDLDPVELVRAVAGSGNGVTVPVISALLLLVGPLDPRTAMMAQPILLVLGAVAVAGAARRIGGSWSAIAAGLTFAVLPTTATATQSYWFGLGSATFAAAAMWALLASDRARNSRIWWFGLCTGLMWLTRTMTLGYAPAMIAAAVVVAAPHRRSLVRAAASIGVAVLVAGPWYAVNASSIFRYLLSYGYGPRAARFGDGGPLERLEFRLERMQIAFGARTLTVLVVSAAIVAAVAIVARMRSGDGSGDSPARRLLQWVTRPAPRGALAMATATVLGTAALVSTSNNGVWFELPVVVFSVILLFGVLGAAPTWWKVVLSAGLLVVAGWNHAAHWWLVDYRPGGFTAHYEYGFEQYDDRFGPTTRELHAQAAREWYDLDEEVLRSVRSDSGGDPVLTVSGNMVLFNSNDLWLAGELDGRPPDIQVPDTADPESIADALTPMVGSGSTTRERVVVVARHDRTLFTPDDDVDELYAEALRQGWRPSERIPMPSGGEVVVLRWHGDR